MRAVFALVLIVGMALAGVAVYMAQGYVSQNEVALAKAAAFREKTGKLVEVYAVNKAMAFGDPLTVDDVETIYVQEKFLPEGAFRVPVEAKEGAEPAEKPKKEAAKPKKDEVVIITASGPLFPPENDKPRFIMRSMEPHEVILASRVTEPGEVADLTGKLDKGMRAFQLKVDAGSGVSTIILPESHIDIYWTGAGGGNVSGEVTRLIESAVRVIAVDSASDQAQMAGGKVRSVTVAASAEQVARLAQAQATGRLALSLVASPEDAVAGLVEVDRNKLLGVEQQEVVAVEAPEVCTIKTRKGDEVVEVPIPCTN